MEWQDRGIVLSVRPYGESSAIVDLFTAAHGRHAGVVRGGHSRRLAAQLQPGNEVAARWRARLAEHLGTLTVELSRSRAGLTAGRASLAGLNAVTALLLVALPERQPYPRLFATTNALLDAMAHVDWPPHYLRWELALLGELGFGLDLARCAITGVTEGLAYVSPRTGRAVSREGAGDWASRLLPLPPVLLGAPGSPREVVQGLRTTGYFLDQHLAQDVLHRALPDARARLVALLAATPDGSALR